jgi:hypothetical protein
MPQHTRFSTGRIYASENEWFAKERKLERSPLGVMRAESGMPALESPKARHAGGVVVTWKSESGDHITQRSPPLLTFL